MQLSDKLIMVLTVLAIELHSEKERIESQK